MPAGELLANPKNWRRHPPAQAQALRSILDKVGFADALLARETPDGLELVDGHLRQELSPDEAVPVLVLDVDEEEADLILATLDPLAAMAVTDEQALWDLLQTIEVPDDVLARALEDMTGQAGPPPLADPDDVPEPPDDPVTQPGDLWVLGDHRLICGDSFEPAVLDRLLGDIRVGAILTDPPYGINLDTDYSQLKGSAKSMLRTGKRTVYPASEVRHGQPSRVLGRNYREVGGDDQPFDASGLSERFAGVKEQFWFGANYYRRTLPGGDLDGSWLVWDKRPGAANVGSEGLDEVFGSAFELIWSKQQHQQRVIRKQWSGFTARNPGMERAHPTEKPVEVLTDILERWTNVGDLILDPFAGSGTLVVAAQQVGRRAAVVEMDPAYCDVIVERWRNFTGGVPERENPPTEAEGS